jgi:hypothetical protein
VTGQGGEWLKFRRDRIYIYDEEERRGNAREAAEGEAEEALGSNRPRRRRT